MILGSVTPSTPDNKGFIFVYGLLLSQPLSRSNATDEALTTAWVTMAPPSQGEGRKQAVFRDYLQLLSAQVFVQ